ncbi:MAG: Fe-S cluster assembly sulfur transfer protein SufU [Acidobacteriota bacterium]
MSDLTDLYQEVILDHNRRPRNFGKLEGADHAAHGHNPLCGDKLTVYLGVEGDTIRDVRFEGSGCAISKASASLMTEAVKGHSITEALELFDRMHALLTTPIDQAVDADSFGKLAVLSGVREFPMRVKCASLSWHTLKAAIANPAAVAKTE